MRTWLKIVVQVLVSFGLLLGYCFSPVPEGILIVTERIIPMIVASDAFFIILFFLIPGFPVTVIMWLINSRFFKLPWPQFVIGQALFYLFWILLAILLVTSIASAVPKFF